MLLRHGGPEPLRGAFTAEESLRPPPVVADAESGGVGCGVSLGAPLPWGGAGGSCGFNKGHVFSSALDKLVFCGVLVCVQPHDPDTFYLVTDSLI